MKTIGLIGGMSWESSLEYYRIMNEAVRESLGGFHSAKCIMYSVDFAPIEEYQHQGEWKKAAKILIDAAQKLQRGGADVLLICANTMHKLAPDVQKSIKVPLLHIADVTAQKIKEKGIKKLGLLGTRFTMEEDFYKDRLTGEHGLTIIVPEKQDRDLIHKVLYSDIQMGKIEQHSRDIFKRIIDKLEDKGAQGIILGCTEIPLYVKKEDYKIPLFDTTEIHARAAVKWALGKV